MRLRGAHRRSGLLTSWRRIRESGLDTALASLAVGGALGRRRRRSNLLSDPVAPPETTRASAAAERRAGEARIDAASDGEHRRAAAEGEIVLVVRSGRRLAHAGGDRSAAFERSRAAKS